MKHATTCKFCKAQIVLNIDDAYAELGDPNKLIPMAACNACADIRVNLRRALDSIARLCGNLIQWSGEKYSDRRAKVLPILHQVTRKYAENLARIYNAQRMIWSEEFGLLLFERPEKWGVIMQKYRQDCTADYSREQQDIPTR